MRIVVWLFRALLFFVLFAFALNNRDEAVVRWFFGYEWHAPMVIVVLIAFGLGCAFGIIAMVPSWWRHRRVARQSAPEMPSAALETAPALPSAPAAEMPLVHPPRDGL